MSLLLRACSVLLYLCQAYLSMMRNPAAPGLMDLIKPDLKACKMYR